MPAVSAAVREAMEQVWPLRVPLRVDVRELPRVVGGHVDVGGDDVGGRR